MDNLPAIVRSTHTWDIRPGKDLRGGEEAIVVSVIERVLPLECDGIVWTEWTLIPLERPRFIKLLVRSDVKTTLKKWLIPR